MRRVYWRHRLYHIDVLDVFRGCQCHTVDHGYVTDRFQHVSGLDSVGEAVGNVEVAVSRRLIPKQEIVGVKRR